MKSVYDGPLTRNEQEVLYHLVRHPEKSDKDIQDLIGMKQSTYSTIKKKLRGDGYYFSSYTPMLNNLGCQLLVVWYVTLNRRTRTEERLAITRNELLGASDIFTILSESNQAVLLSISEDIAAHVDISDRLMSLYERHDFMEEVHFVQFPFDVSRMFNFFDFTFMLNKLFQVEPMEELVRDFDVSSNDFRCPVEKGALNDLEKRIFMGLVQNPELSDSLLSSKIGCSRQVFTRVKTRFLEEGKLRRQRIISMEKLGYRVLAMTHSRYSPHKPLNARGVCIQRVTTLQNPIFHMCRDRESVTLSAFRSFEEYKTVQNEIISFCTQWETLKGEPVTIVLSLPRVFEIKWLAFEPLVKRLMEDL